MYTDKVLEHFQQPRNQGQLIASDSVGIQGNPICGDVMKMYLHIKEGVICDIKFETLGCAAAIAVSSALTERAKDLTLTAALAISKDDIVNDLGGLPVAKVHCSMLGVDALHQAIKDYQSRQQPA